MSHAGGGAGEGIALSTSPELRGNVNGSGSPGEGEGATPARPAMMLVSSAHIDDSTEAEAEVEEPSPALSRRSHDEGAAPRELLHQRGQHPADIVMDAPAADVHSAHAHRYNPSYAAQTARTRQPENSQGSGSTTGATEGGSGLQRTDPRDGNALDAADDQLVSSGRPQHARIPTYTRSWADSPVSTPASDEIRPLSMTPNRERSESESLGGMNGARSAYNFNDDSLDSPVSAVSGAEARYRNSPLSRDLPLHDQATGTPVATAVNASDRPADENILSGTEPCQDGDVLAETSSTRMKPAPIVELASNETKNTAATHRQLSSAVREQEAQASLTGSAPFSIPVERTDSVESSSSNAAYHLARSGSMASTSGGTGTGSPATRRDSSGFSSPPTKTGSPQVPHGEADPTSLDGPRRGSAALGSAGKPSAAVLQAQRAQLQSVSYSQYGRREASNLTSSTSTSRAADGGGRAAAGTSYSSTSMVGGHGHGGQSQEGYASHDRRFSTDSNAATHHHKGSSLAHAHETAGAADTAARGAEPAQPRTPAKDRSLQAQQRSHSYSREEPSSGTRGRDGYDEGSTGRDRERDKEKSRAVSSSSRKQLGEWTLGKTLGAGSMGKVKLGVSSVTGGKVSLARC